MSVPLTKRLEDEVAAFAASLEAMPDDLLMDVMAAPPPKSFKPVYWSDPKLVAVQYGSSYAADSDPEVSDNVELGED